jgi:hypothetical protein
MVNRAASRGNIVKPALNCRNAGATQRHALVGPAFRTAEIR